MSRHAVTDRFAARLVCATVLSFCGTLAVSGQLPKEAGTLAVSGQLPKEAELRIHVGGLLCEEIGGNDDKVVTDKAVPEKAIAKISVTINGSDEPSAAVPASKCEWVSLRIPSVDPKGSFLSLRLTDKTLGDKGRTRCRELKFEAPGFDVWFGERGTGPVKRLTVSGDRLPYARIAKAKIHEKNPVPGRTDINCDERGAVPGHLVGVQFDIEEVRFQIFPKVDIKCDLVVDASDRVAKAATPTEVDYTNRLADIVSRQGLEAKRCHAATDVPEEVILESLGGKKPALKIKVN